MSLPPPESVPLFRDHVERVLAFLDQHYHGVPYDEKHHLKFMALLFVSKQRGHAEALLALSQSKSPDVLLVARSMLEGLMLLRWATGNPKSRRGLKWRAFAYVHDWRLIRMKEGRGEHVDSERKNQVNDFLRKHRDLVLSKEAKENLQTGVAAPDDPYVSLGRPFVRSSFQSAQGEVLYDGVYSRLSAYHHWEVTGFMESIKRKGKYVVYSREVSPSDLLLTVFLAAHCLTKTVQVANSLVRIGPPGEAENMDGEWLALYNGAAAAVGLSVPKGDGT